MAKLKSAIGKSLNTNKVSVQASNGAIYYRDLLNLSVFDTEDDNKEYKVCELFEQVVEVKKTYKETKATVDLVETELEELSSDYRSLKDALWKYIKNLEEINIQQSIVIDSLSKKIDILVERIKVLENKTELL